MKPYLQPLKNFIIFREDTTYADQKSSLIHTIEPEVAWIVECVGAEVKDLKVGDRIIPTPGKAVQVYFGDTKFKIFTILESDILGIYEC